MARRKFRHAPRYEEQGERSFQEYLFTQPAPLTNRTELLRLIRGGEDTYLELKLKLSNPERIVQEIVALANTDGGTIVFGVSDQLRVEGVHNPESVQTELVRICREDVYPPLIPLIDTIAFDSGRRIVKLEIDGRRRPYRTRDGKFYFRIGAEKREATREELSAWLDENRPLAYENIPLTGVFEADFDDGLLWSFANAFEGEIVGGSLYQTAEFLKKDLLLAVGSGDEFLPTIAGVLLFGKNERVAELVPRSAVTAIRYSGGQIVEKAEIHGNLLSIYEGAQSFVKRYCDLLKFKPKKEKQHKTSPVHRRGAYHIYSIFEAIANAIMHRDLALRDMNTRILIYDDYIEVINPRRTNGFVPPASKAIRYGITQRINPQIASIFSKREYGSNLPRGGLPMILRGSQQFSGKKVEIYTANDEFKIKIHSL
jgi:ATP-dependent DNA helicase RecG